MKEVLLGERIEPMKILGEAIKVYLKKGGKFLFKVTGAEAESTYGEELLEHYIVGYDDEGQELKIAVVDIDFVITQ